MPEFVIETSNLTKNYDDFCAVNGIDLNIEKGKIYGLLGRNGAGKTTTMCMLLGLTKPSDGEIKLFGKDVKKHRKLVYKKIGSLIETPGFYPEKNAEENLKIFCKIRGSYNQQRIDEILKLVNLFDQKDKKFKNYSLGMKQRLGLALALVHEPELLILDEPINGLDPVGIKEIRDLLVNISSEREITILISSHILSEIESIADEIIVINEGRLVSQVTREEFDKNCEKKVIFTVSDVALARKIFYKAGLKEKDFESIGDKIYLYNYLDKRAFLNRQLVRNNVDVNDIILKEESLEEFFMRIIRDGDKDDS